MNISKINLFDIANGPGIRVSLFVSGCNFHCKGCFNETAQDFNAGIKYTQEHENLILNRLKHPDFKGLSILGGDPLCQNEKDLKILLDLCKKVKALNKDIWIWSGFYKTELNMLQNDLINECDYFVDGRFEESLKDLTLPWRGSSNQHIIKIRP